MGGIWLKYWQSHTPFAKKGQLLSALVVLRLLPPELIQVSPFHLSGALRECRVTTNYDPMSTSSIHHSSALADAILIGSPAAALENSFLPKGPGNGPS